MNNRTAKPTRGVKSRIRCPRIFAFALALSLLFGSCFRDDGDSGVSDKAQILITVKLPDASLPVPDGATRQATTESDIADLRILVFEQVNGNGYVFSYQVSGTEITPEAGLQRFTAELTARGSQMKIMVLANTGALSGSFRPAAGTPEADVRREIEFDFPANGMTANLPMYGEALLNNGIIRGGNMISLVALRAVARVDVVKDLEDGTEEFILEEVYAFRVRNKARFIPDEVADNSAPVVTSPSVPDDAAFLSDPISIASADVESITGLYIPESQGAATEADVLDGITTIVVGGRFGGAGNDITYYRVDFDPDLSGQQLGQVLRNHRYIFNIKNVTSPGWSTPEDAAMNFAASMLIEIEAWQDFASDIYFGENRFSISSRSMSLRYVGNRTRQLDVESTLSYTIQWLDENGDPEGTPTSEQGVTISNDNFDATIVRETGDPDQVSHLSVRTRHDNYDGDVISDKLRISVANWKIDISINQDNTAVYFNRSFNILTGMDYLGAIGYLGTTSNTPTATASAQAMRQILNMQFKPDAQIKIGGFAFDQINDYTDPSFNSTTTTNVDLMKRIIRVQDVIYLSYLVEVSTQVLPWLFDWLNADSRRVLIVAADNSTTNARVLSELAGDGTWVFTSTGMTQYRRAASSEETAEFFSGPFGDVDPDARFNKVDVTAGYNSTYPATVTPLILDGTNNAMVVGVNKARRVIYIGDVNLFQSGRLSNNNGNVESDLDRLFANMWAWVVEQLIYGDE